MVQILYEDHHILLADKPPGLIVHPKDSEHSATLLNLVRDHLRRTGAWDAEDPNAFRPIPCNRLDRFTSGIVIFAKTREAMRIMNRKLQQREVMKRYRCIVLGKPKPASGKLEHYLLKNRDGTHVTVQKHPVRGSQYACMEYRTISVQGGRSLLECRLITGRTHQLRAQLAAIGNPILGDMRYGNLQQNQRYGKHHQMLCACEVTFSFQTDTGVLESLRGKTFRTHWRLDLSF